jgi:N-acetylneuraminic acid mutarotase
MILKVIILLLIMFPSQSLAAWLSVRPLNQPRYCHTATLLPNEKILVIGGRGQKGGKPYDSLKSVEVYSDATKTWSAESPLQEARFSHTATLLPNGKVLVIGGIAPNNTYPRAELFTPNVGWEYADTRSGKIGHVALLLPNGKVLVAGGYGNNGYGYNSYLNMAELYNPATGTWSPTGFMADARYEPIAELLPNGKVLVAGGYDGYQALASAEIYDPVTEKWSRVGDMTEVRSCHASALLRNGKVLVAGGLGFYGIETAEFYNPLTGTWSPTGSLKGGRGYCRITAMPDGKALATGGIGNNAAGQEILGLKTAELYDPATGTWKETTPMREGRMWHTAMLHENKALVIAGTNIPPDATGGIFIALAGAEKFNPRNIPTAALFLLLGNN